MAVGCVAPRPLLPVRVASILYTSSLLGSTSTRLAPQNMALASSHLPLALSKTLRTVLHQPANRGASDAVRAFSTVSRQLRAHARQHHETRVVPFSQRQLYQVVANVPEYSQFVPWCMASHVVKHIDDRHMIADLSVGFRMLSEKYTSVVTLDPLRSVKVDVPTSNLFDYLITDWTFQPGNDPSTSHLTFYLEFAFRNPLYQRATDLFFEDVVKQMVSAFENRCHVKYQPAEHKGAILHRW